MNRSEALAGPGRRPPVGVLVLLLAAAALPAAEEPAATAFLNACAERAAAAAEAGRAVVRGEDGWLFLAKELRHLGVGPFWGPRATEAGTARKEAWRDPLPAILHVHRQLAAMDIELLLVPVPPRAALYADRTGLPAPLGPGGRPERVDLQLQRFYTELGEEGVQVVDLMPLLLEARDDEDERGLVACMQDTHWSSRACSLAADAIRAAVEDRRWLEGRERTEYAVATEELTIRGDLLDRQQGELEPETLVLHRVGPDGQGVEPDPASPVVLLADSHGLVFHTGGKGLHARGAGLADHLARAFGFPVDLVAQRGGATTALLSLARAFYRDAAYRNGKRLIVWCFAAREFTENANGWREVPLQPR